MRYIMAQTIREILDAREREVRRAIDDVRTRQLEPLERELTEIVAARTALMNIDHMLRPNPSELPELSGVYMRMTYEELAVQALKEMLTPEGTIREIQEHIRKNYGREIAQGSFSPVLSRMRDKGKLVKKGKVWALPPEYDL